MKKIFIVLAFTSFLLACEKENPPTDEIEAQLGDSFEIELDANWSTGYHWSWMNRSIITVADTIDFNYIQEDPGLGGSSGTEIWTFIAKSSGEETLIFKYLPAGATGNEEGETMTFKVLVNS